MAELVSVAFSQHSNADVVLSCIHVLAAGLHCANSVLNQIIGTQVSERLVILLKVGLCRLITISNRDCVILIVVARRACLKKVSACLVNCANKQTDAEGTFSRMSSLDLALSGDFGDQPLSGMVAAVRIPVVKALLAHKLAEEPCVCSHA